MKNPLIALQAMLFAFIGHPLDRAVLNVRKAAKRHARELADARYEQDMVRFYRDQAEAVDPKERWREYATLRDLQQDHETELLVQQGRLDGAAATLASCQLRLKALQERYPEGSDLASA